MEVERNLQRALCPERHPDTTAGGACPKTAGEISRAEPSLKHAKAWDAGSRTAAEGSPVRTCMAIRGADSSTTPFSVFSVAWAKLQVRDGEAQLTPGACLISRMQDEGLSLGCGCARASVVP